jgi:hypothetical protein
MASDEWKTNFGIASSSGLTGELAMTLNQKSVLKEKYSIGDSVLMPLSLPQATSMRMK